MCEGVDPETPTPTVPDLSVTSNPGLISSSSHTTRHSEFFCNRSSFHSYNCFPVKTIKVTMILITGFLYVLAPVIQPPVIVSPLNGTIFESLHGE